MKNEQLHSQKIANTSRQSIYQYQTNFDKLKQQNNVWDLDMSSDVFGSPFDSVSSDWIQFSWPSTGYSEASIEPELRKTVSSLLKLYAGTHTYKKAKTNATNGTTLTPNKIQLSKIENLIRHIERFSFSSSFFFFFSLFFFLKFVLYNNHAGSYTHVPNSFWSES